MAKVNIGVIGLGVMGESSSLRSIPKFVSIQADHTTNPHRFSEGLDNDLITSDVLNGRPDDWVRNSFIGFQVNWT